MKTCGWKDRRPNIVAPLAADGIEAIKLKIKRPSKRWRVGRHGPYRLPKVVVAYLQGHVDVYLSIDVIDAESTLIEHFVQVSVTEE